MLSSERFAIVRPSGNDLFNIETGEVHPFGSAASRSAYSQSVTHCVARCLAKWTRVLPDRRGRLIAAFGPGVAVRDLQSAYPGCNTAHDVESAEDALMSADLTKGMSPAGRALDYAHRTNEKVRQWRAALPLQELALSALYGGVQIGTYKKPPARPRKGFRRVIEDVISAYPYTASGLLPSVAHCRVERGQRRGAVLWLVGAIQNDRALFTRDDDGNVGYSPEVYGWYTPEEIEYHVAHGRVQLQRVLASITTNRSDKYLASCIEHLFDARESHVRGTAGRSVLKAALNGLIGKFAAPISSWRMADANESKSVKKSRAYPIVTIGPVSIVDDPRLRGLYHRNTNGLWTAISYSRARVRLWERIDSITAQGGRVLWVHTDCVIADVPQAYRATYGAGLGDWRSVG